MKDQVYGFSIYTYFHRAKYMPRMCETWDLIPSTTEVNKSAIIIYICFKSLFLLFCRSSEC